MKREFELLNHDVVIMKIKAESVESAADFVRRKLKEDDDFCNLNPARLRLKEVKKKYMEYYDLDGNRSYRLEE